MDQCKHCIVRGDVAACEQTDCDKHEYWYALTLRARVARLEGFVKFIADRHYADGLSKAMIIEKARRALEEK